MAQQINLHDPILLAPRRLFSARAMTQAMALLVLSLLVASVWVWSSTAALRRGLETSLQVQANERTRLVNALPQSSQAGTDALEQELAQLQQTIAQRRELLDELQRSQSLGGRSHAAWLRLIAQTIPPSAWLTEMQVDERRFEIAGYLLQPEAMRGWLARIADDPLAAGQPIHAVKLERVVDTQRFGSTAAGLEVWSFSIVSGKPAPAGAAASESAR